MNESEVLEFAARGINSCLEKVSCKVAPKSWMYQKNRLSQEDSSK